MSGESKISHLDKDPADILKGKKRLGEGARLDVKRGCIEDLFDHHYREGVSLAAARDCASCGRVGPHRSYVAVGGGYILVLMHPEGPAPLSRSLQGRVFNLPNGELGVLVECICEICSEHFSQVMSARGIGSGDQTGKKTLLN